MRIRDEKQPVEAIRRDPGPVRLRRGRCDQCQLAGKTMVDGQWLCAAHALEAVGGPKAER